MTDPTPTLSPAAQEVLKAAYVATGNLNWQTNFYASYAAAVLRAAADQVVPMGDYTSGEVMLIAMNMRVKLLAIAAELEAAQ